ncbi:replication/maintenance protein RepL [Bacillus sp. FSL W8-1202]
MRKLELKEWQRKYAEIKTEKPDAELHHISGPYYMDKHGKTGQFITNAQIESRRRYNYIKRQNTERASKYYVNCYDEPVKELTASLSLSELGALIKLLPYLKFQKHGLLFDKGKPMNLERIAEIIGKSDRQASRTMTKLTTAGAIIREGHGAGTQYYVSESFHSIGKTIAGATYTKLYQQETKRRIRNLTLQECGLLYKMLPYFHQTEYYLCENPTSQGEAIEHMTQERLSEVIGESLPTVKRHMSALMKANLVMKMQARNSAIVVNPDVMFRAEKETEYTNTVRGHFRELDRSE